MISSLGAIADHGDREADLLLNELYILSAVLRQFLEFFDTADITLPSGEFLQYGLSLLQLVGYREISGHFTIDLIAYTYRDLLQISQCIQYGKCYIGSALQTTAVLGSYTVEPAHTSGASGGSTELTTVTAAAAKLICLVTEDLGYESACSYCGRVCSTYGNDLLDLIRRDTCTNSTVCCQGGGRSYHRVDS